MTASGMCDRGDGENRQSPTVPYLRVFVDEHESIGNIGVAEMDERGSNPPATLHLQHKERPVGKRYP
eukprot:scaffold240392_cov33-Tisochrysis_lutea.AAC.5